MGKYYEYYTFRYNRAHNSVEIWRLCAGWEKHLARIPVSDPTTRRFSIGLVEELIGASSTRSLLTDRNCRGVTVYFDLDTFCRQFPKGLVKDWVPQGGFSHSLCGKLITRFKTFIKEIHHACTRNHPLP